MIKLSIMDLGVYLACVLAIGVSLYAVDHTGDLLDSCNEHWAKNYKEMCTLQDQWAYPENSFPIGDLNFSINSTP